jgi:transposase-like protein
MGINLDGERGILGMWVGPTGGEGAKQWANMLTELRNRGILDACIVCCDGLRGIPDAILAAWPNASARTCVVHLVRNALRYASKKVLADHHQTDAADLPRRRSRLPRTRSPSSPRSGSRPIRRWSRCGDVHGPEFTPFLAFPVEVRRSCSPPTASNH